MGLLMLLPQSPAPPPSRAASPPSPRSASSGCSSRGGRPAPAVGAPQIDFGQLLDAHRAVQQKHRAKDDGKRREARVGDGAEAGDASAAARRRRRVAD